MELDPQYLDAGLWGLFFATFLAATVIPFSSEAIFLSFLALDYNVAQVLIVSSVGNWLGGMLSFGMGWLVPLERIPTWLSGDPVKVKKWVEHIRPRGAIWSILCWLPLIGDLIALALGSLRVSPVTTAVLMFVGKAGRYAIIAWFWYQL